MSIKDLYTTAQRNGFYLPAQKSNIINEDYLRRVITGKLFCPKYSDIKLLPCPTPPDKITLLEMARKIKCPNNLKLGIDDPDHLPDKDWLIKVISTYR